MKKFSSCLNLKKNNLNNPFFSRNVLLSSVLTFEEKDFEVVSNVRENIPEVFVNLSVVWTISFPRSSVYIRQNSYIINGN